MSLAPYRPRQGVYARGAAAAGLLLLSLFASARLYQMLPSSESFELLGLDVPYSACWASVLFVLLGGVVCMFTIGLRTGLNAIDSKTGGFVDLLIETEAELYKVSWPTKDQLTTSTTVVFLCMIIVGVLLFCIDRVVAWVMSVLRVLPA